MATPRENPYSNFNFVVEFDGVEVAAFSEVSGLDSESTPIEYREGGEAINTVRKFPGMLKHANVILKRGITGSTVLWQWRKDVRDSSTIRPPYKEVTIKLLNEKSERDKPAMVFKLHKAWPTKITGPSMNAKGNDFAVEQLDLVHEYLEIE
jgi:phage tail-like protein